MKSARWIAALIAVTIVCQHLQFAAPGGYPLTLGTITGLVLVLWLSSVRALGPAFIAVLTVCLLGSLPVFLAPDYVDAVQFMRTFALFLVAAVVVASGARGERIALLRSPVVVRTIFTCLATIVVLSICQVLLGMRGEILLFNPFRGHQYLYQYTPLMAEGLPPRAQGFFLEPSYNAFVICTLTVYIVASRQMVKRALGLCIAGLMVTQSATGLILFAGLMLFSAATRGPRSMIAGLGCTAVGYQLVGTYLIGRISSISHSGSSANYRLEAPRRVISMVMRENPFGLPLGSIDHVMEAFSLPNGETRGTSLDNGYYVILFYFGWAGATLIGVGIILAINSSARSLRASSSIKDRYRAIIPWWLAGSLLFSGGIMLPEFALMTWLTLQAWRNSRPTIDEGRVDEPANLEYRHSYL